MDFLRNFSAFYIITLMCQPAFADLPLTVEDLITDKNKFKLITNLNYYNQSQRNLIEQGYSVVDLGNGRTITLPNPSTEGVSNTDSLIGTLGLNYGVTDKWEIGAKVNALHRQTRQNTSEAVVFNNHLDTADLNYAFGGNQDLQVQAMTSQEMDETQGAIAPVYALGAFMIGTGRFIATRYVSRSVAVNAARNGSNVMVRGTSQQARSLARQAYGKNNVTRHGPSGHKSHVDYSHYQPTIRNGNNGHIFYGNRYLR